MIKDRALKEELVSIFESLQIEYDAENNKYYDLTCEETIFLLPLIPEKYFRQNDVKKITLNDLISTVKSIEDDLVQLFGGAHDEDK